MSVHVTAAVWDRPMPTVAGVTAPALKLVALALADHASLDGRGVWPAVGTLAAMTGLSERTVQRALRGLEASGVIVLARRATNRAPAAYDFGPWYTPPLRHPEARGVTMTPRGRHHDTSRGVTVTPEPSLNRHITGGARAEEPEPDPNGAAKARALLDDLQERRTARARVKAAAEASGAPDGP